MLKNKPWFRFETNYPILQKSQYVADSGGSKYLKSQSKTEHQLLKKK